MSRRRARGHTPDATIIKRRCGPQCAAPVAQAALFVPTAETEMRLLITDTTWNMASMATLMRDRGFLISEAASGEEVLTHLAQGDYDAVLIDPDLPDIAATSLIRRIRAEAPRLPVCLCARQVARRDRLRALAAGADDVLVWPYNGDEAAARLRAFARRARGFADPTPEIAGLTVDFDRRTIRFGGEVLRLTRLEYELVETLVLARGRLVPRETIITRLYGWDGEPEWKILDVYVCRIRAKLAVLGAPAETIATSFGRGYRINLIAAYLDSAA